MSPRISLVTGVDHAMFDQLLLLGGSLRRHSPGMPLHVLDFGLTEAQRSFIRRRYVLVDKPADIGVRRHPWYYKAAIGRYMANLSWDAVVWIDADMFAVADLGPPLLTLFNEMQQGGHTIAAAHSGFTIAQQLAHDPAPHYAQLVRQFDMTAPYLGGGLFLCRSAEFLGRYTAQTDAMSYEMLFEQNAFNLVALGDRRQVRVLDQLRWNLAANELDRLRIAVSGPEIAITGGAEPALILHATSTDRANDLIDDLLPLEANGQAFKIKVRMIKRPQELFDFQRQLTIETIKQDADALLECGAWPSTPVALPR
jgi:hypothetical protein